MRNHDVGPNDLGPLKRKIHINRVLENNENSLKVEVDLGGYLKRVELDKSNFEYPEVIWEGHQDFKVDVPEQTVWDKGLLP